MFGVIVCPRCNRVRGVDLSRREVTCPGCGLSIDVSKAKVYFRTENQTELAEAVRQMTREIAPGLDSTLEEAWTVGGGEGEASPKKRDEQGLMIAATKLTEEKGGFTIDELADYLEVDDREWLRTKVSNLLSGGQIYEPETDIFRAI
jgi:hypothetical protein